MRYKCLYIFLGLVLLGSCHKKEEPLGPGAVASIEVSEKTVFLEADEESTVSIEVTTQKDWTLEGLGDGVREWLGADVTSGSGNATVVLTAKSFNPFNDERIAVLVFRAADAKAPVIVRQKADPARTIVLSENAVAFGEEAGEELTVEIITQKPWVLEGYTEEISSWLSVDATSGESGTTLRLKTLTANLDLADRTASLAFRIDRVNAARLDISQPTGITISAGVNELQLSSAAGDEGQITITTTTDRFPWRVEGLTEDVSTWLSVSPASGTGTSKTVTVSTLKENESALPRTAEISFVISEKICCSVTVKQQSSALQTFSISWKAGANVNSLTVKGNSDSPHENFPWVDTWSTLNDVNREYKNGKGGAVVRKGDYAVAATWLFLDSVTGEWIPLEMGPVRQPVLASGGTTYSIMVYYQNQESANIRFNWSYIKIPAVEGYRLSHLKVTGINAASSACLIFGSDKSAVNGFLEDSNNRVTFGLNDPVDREFTTTQANTNYYLSTSADRTVDSFEFTYTEVR